MPKPALALAIGALTVSTVFAAPAAATAPTIDQTAADGHRGVIVANGTSPLGDCRVRSARAVEIEPRPQCGVRGLPPLFPAITATDLDLQR